MNDLIGKVVMITGASGNLGSATTMKFKELGAKLALVDRSVDQLHNKFGLSVLRYVCKRLPVYSRTTARLLHSTIGFF